MDAGARGLGSLTGSGPRPTTPAIEATAVGYRYAGAPSSTGVGPLDLRVDAGTIVGILGPNGAGKSTLLRLLAATMPPGEGELRILGERIAAGPPRGRPRLAGALLRRIGYAPDEAPHFDRLSGRENALFFARAAGTPGAEARAAIDALFERLALAADADRQAGDYSYGMRRKLLLAAVAVPMPDLLLLDEPTLGLDPPSRAAVLELLRERAAAGAACVLATNDVAAGESCDRVVFLRDGVIVVEGEPGALIAGLGGETTIRVMLDDGGGPATLEVEGVRAVASGPGTLELRSARGSVALPDVCAALVSRGRAIRAIEVRAPDLRDVYTRATGEAWTAGDTA